MVAENTYDVSYVRNGNIEFYAKGVSLDKARALATALGSSITLAITGDNGFQGGGQLKQAISGVRVTRSFKTGTVRDIQTRVTEALTVTTSGQEMFALSYVPLISGGNMTVTVNGSASRPDVVWDLINDTFGTPYLYITVPTLATTDAVSATYNYVRSTTNPVTVTGETPSGSVNGTNKVFTTAYDYKPGSLVVTTSVDAVSGKATVIDGGGVYFEVYHLSHDTAVALPTGTTITVDYKYSPDDNAAIPAAEDHHTHLPAYAGQAVSQPFPS